MKNILKYLASCAALAIVASAHVACSEEEGADIQGATTPIVYLNSGMASDLGYHTFVYSVTHTPGSALTSGFEVKVPVKVSLKTTSEIRATLSVDNSLIASYNQARDASCKEVPQSSMQIENTSLTIPAGTYISTDSVKVTIPVEALSTMKDDDGYLIPVKISSVTGAVLSATENRFFIRIDIINNNINASAANNSVTGTMIATAGKTTWVATPDKAPTTQTNNATMLFDGVTSTAGRWVGSFYDISVTVTIDMQQVYNNITALYCYGAASGWTFRYSSDGVTWKMLGVTTKAYNSTSAANIIFYSPISARYVRFTVPATANANTPGGMRSSVSVYEYSIYTTN